jgi:hypothetical protein
MERISLSNFICIQPPEALYGSYGVTIALLASGETICFLILIRMIIDQTRYACN